MQQRFTVLQIAWAALMFGVLACALAVYFMLTIGGLELAAMPVQVLTYVAPVAVVGMVGGTVLRRRFVDAIPAGVTPEQRMEKYLAAVIVGLAVTEGFGLLVITLALLAGAPTWALVGGGLATGVMALSGPQRDEAGLGR